SSTPLTPRSPLFPSTPPFRSPEVPRLAAAKRQSLAVKGEPSVLQARACRSKLSRMLSSRAMQSSERKGEAFFALEILALLVGHRSEEHTSELQSRENLVCRLL